MILVITNDEVEMSTYEVVKWLTYYDANFYILTPSRLLNSNFCIKISVNESNWEFKISEDEKIDVKEIKAIWYRRWDWSLNELDSSLFEGNFMDKNNMKITMIKNTMTFNSFFKSEFNKLSNFLFKILENKNWINFPLIHMSIPINNKLLMLTIASSCLLKIPETIICNNKNDFEMFFSNKEIDGFIINPISEGFTLFDEVGIPYTYYTSELEFSHIDRITDDNFFPFLVQEKINKLYEIRVFYFFGDFYSMAIFSQSNELTKVDFRNYDYHLPNRKMPYKLPEIIETNLKTLFDRIGLNCGSVDLIRTLNGDYCFLEINPVGQFGMVSHPCNYNLEKLIAEKLIFMDNN